MLVIDSAQGGSGPPSSHQLGGAALRGGNIPPNPLQEAALVLTGAAGAGPPSAAHGIDIDDQGNGMLTASQLYRLIRQPKPIADRQFEIEFLDSGVEAFSFTFG